MDKSEVERYAALPYPVEIMPDEDGEGFNAAVPLLKGCMAFGETVEEAYAALQDVKRAWFEIALSKGWRIPELPALDEKAYSGEFRVRLPRYLHRALAQLAEEEGTSLNQLVVALLSEGAERQRIIGPVREDSDPDSDTATVAKCVERILSELEAIRADAARSAALRQHETSSQAAFDQQYVTFLRPTTMVTRPRQSYGTDTPVGKTGILTEIQEAN